MDRADKPCVYFLDLVTLAHMFQWIIWWITVQVQHIGKGKMMDLYWSLILGSGDCVCISCCFLSEIDMKVKMISYM